MRKYVFDSIGELLRYTGKASPWQVPRSSQETGQGRDAWFGTPDYKSAETLAIYGWTQGREKLYRATASMPHRPYSHPAKSYDVAGMFPDVTRAIAGDPENMLIFTAPERAHCPVIRLRVGVSYSSGISVEHIENRGAAIVSIVDSLEHSGYQCEIIADSSWSYRSLRNEVFQFQTFIKHAGQSVEIDQIAFALMHPSFTRRLMFAAIEQEPEGATIRGDFYGIPYDLTPEDVSEVCFQPMLASRDCSSFTTPIQARETVKRQIENTLGVSIEF